MNPTNTDELRPLPFEPKPEAAMSEKKELLTTNRKALTINLDGQKYGTFAGIEQIC